MGCQNTHQKGCVAHIGFNNIVTSQHHHVEMDGTKTLWKSHTRNGILDVGDAECCPDVINRTADALDHNIHT
jgi:hypothetical protein